MPSKILYTIEYIRDNKHILYKNKNSDSEIWKHFLKLHPADITDILVLYSYQEMHTLMVSLSLPVQADVFMEMSKETRHQLFLLCNQKEREYLIDNLTIDELTDFFDDLSDEELNRYIRLLNKKERNTVLSLLKFSETSAAGVMDSDVFVLSQNITVEKTIELLQRIKPEKKLHRSIYVVNKQNQLVGMIFLEDLVLKSPKTTIETMLHKVPYKIDAETDQSDVAQHMLKYHIDIAPVIDKTNYFLGVIASDTLAEVMEDEASEDIFRMASMTPIKDAYFETSFQRLLIQRGGILCVLLLLQSISTFIISQYQSLLAGFLIAYTGLITSTGGNVSSQASALVIQGLAAGEITIKEMIRFLKRECIFSLFLSVALSSIAFARTYFFSGLFIESTIIGLSLFVLTLFSTIIGSLIPFFLHRLGLDPAHSAGPLLATFMDIFGVILFCLISKFFL